ncbi:MAG: sulfite exporter TauE/SafE family protein [Gammaproteobacteria bacterium]|nr:sulfite exporter TauE/SafE family protein [Gammaproteobacteria bacterium]
MITLLIKIFVIAFSAIAFLMILRLYFLQRQQLAKIKKKFRLIISATIAYFCDTLGLGSFAILIAFDKSWNLIDDALLPGTLNSQAIIPSMIESVFFLQVIKVDTTMLLTLLIAATIGGFIGGYVVSRFNRQLIRLAMAIAFTFITLLIIANQLHLLPIGGNKTVLSGIPLIISFIVVLLASSLGAVGIGIFAPIQTLFFLFGISPLIAYPVMTTACALQQLSTALPFIIRQRIAIKETLIMALFSSIGVLLAAPLIAHINFSELRWLLLVVVIYNVFMLSRSYHRNRN